MTAHVPSTLFAVERFSAVYPEAKELLTLHWDEIAPHKSLLTINPDLPAYEALERADKLCVITARHMGTLVGYIVMMICMHPHYCHVKMAIDDIHFLHPAHRKGSVGLRLLVAAKEEMQRRGVQVMSLRTKASQNHGLLFERIGFKQQDIVYTAQIGD